MKYDKKPAMTEYGCTVGADRRTFMLSYGVSMKCRLATGLLLAALCASAATNYVVPWYANPVSTNVTYDVSLVNDPTDGVLAAKITTAWATVSGADALSGKTAAVKTMGDTTYFRPKFYVLCIDGDIVEFTMTKDLSSAVWTNTLVAADLATTANASGAATDLKVSDDGRLAFLNYGGTWKALGYKTPAWTLHVLDANGDEVTDATVAKRDYLKWLKEDGTTHQYVLNDIQNGGSAYITDGKWQIGIYNYYGAIGLGRLADATESALLNGCAGEVLDLTAGKARFIDDKDYKIRWSTECALGIPEGDSTARVILHSPNLETMQKIMGGWNNAYEEIVFDMPKVTTKTPGTADDGFWSYAKRIVLNLPSVTNANHYLEFVRCTSDWNIAEPDTVLYASESNWEDFKFPALEMVGTSAFRLFYCSGVLNLPSAKSIGATAFYRSYHNPHETHGRIEALLSPENCTLTNIGSQAFVYNTNLWRVVIGAAPEGVLFSGASRYPQHFGMCHGLREVVFTGGTPSFELISGYTGDNAQYNGTYAHNSFDQDRLKLAFVIPRDNATWESFIEGNYRAATDSEIATYMAQNPGRYVPFGVVTNMDIFNTENEQFLAYDDTLGGEAPVAVSPEFDAEYGDVTVSILQGNAPDSSGRYAPGTILRFTAVPDISAGGSFRKWYGNGIGTNDATSASIVVTVNKNMDIAARFVHPWTIQNYDSTAKTATATDGRFVINLSGMDDSRHGFRLGKSSYNEYGGLFDITISDNGGGGVTTNMTANYHTLDLGGEFRLEGDPTPWVAEEFANAPAIAVFPIAYKDTVRTFYSPGTITVQPPQLLFSVHSTRNKQLATFESVILDEPTMPGRLMAYNFVGQSRAVKKLVLQTPSLQQLDDNVFWSVNIAQNLSQWDLSSVTNITPKSLTTQYINNNATTYLNGRKLFNSYGDFRLPALRFVATSADAGSALSPMPYMTSLVLGGKTTADTVTSLGDGAFAGNSSMTNLVIHTDANITVGTGIFGDHAGYNGGDVVYPGHTPEHMTFTGAAPNTDVFANLLDGIGESDAPVMVTVAKAARGWYSKSYIDYGPTTAERALAGVDAPTVFGAYRVNGVLKALFLTPEPRKSFVMVIK